jgi:hypothetical protein
MIRRLGFFRELGHGDEDGPSLVEARQTAPTMDQDHMAQYLDAGRTVAATGVLVDDVFDPGITGVAPLELVTDGPGYGRGIWPITSGSTTSRCRRTSSATFASGHGSHPP